ncbi:DUF2398 family protein [Rhodococcus sp. BP-332]|uniref:DUF2398 family protein n=1 Tax=Rhodococcus sp. BP-332 TaxID=2739447 RepID=UPI001C9AD362|nr:DUF2398 family protein [Rhodococcus sp. BP-332]MBY6675458.1 DUF2398 family protein [Rhodococcus sp. BP-332]
MRARTIPSLALDSYQRAARVVLSHHLITRTYPDRIALPLVRRWATELREDMLDLFGYRLEVTETTARLYPVLDRLDASRPARTTSDRVFDRRRYAFLALTLAALGRAGDQITLSELAVQVASDAGRVVGVDLDTERATDRDAFVDAVGWLSVRGAITLADGDAGGWAHNPDAGEALYDIDRSVVVALFRPPRALQHLRSTAHLLHSTTDDPADRARRARRALVEQPVVHGPDSVPDNRSVEDVRLLTGLSVERRAEGIALIDTSGRLSDIRFPSTGTVAQVALLLAGEIAERVLDPDADDRTTLEADIDPTDTLLAALDSAIPDGGVVDDLVDDSVAPDTVEASDETIRHPFVADSWLDETVGALVDAYGRTFAAQWQADRAGVRAAAVALLTNLTLVAPVRGGIVALPALARYRGVVVTVREQASAGLFPTDHTSTLEEHTP